MSELGADLLPKGSWPELLPGLQQLASAAEPRHVEAALAVLTNLAAYCIDSLRPLLGPLQQLLGQCLGHAQLRVQVRGGQGYGGWWREEVWVLVMETTGAGEGTTSDDEGWGAPCSRSRAQAGRLQRITANTVMPLAFGVLEVGKGGEL